MLIPLKRTAGHAPCFFWACCLEGPSEGFGLCSLLHSCVLVHCVQRIVNPMLCEVQPRKQLWFYPWNSLLRLSLCSCFQRGSICCIRKTSSNSKLSAFKAALSPLKKMLSKKPLLPSYFLLHWVPTKQLEFYVSSLKVPGHALKFRWSEGPWLFSLVVVMLPGPLMAEEQEMTESHNFPADA